MGSTASPHPAIPRANATEKSPVAGKKRVDKPLDIPIMPVILSGENPSECDSRPETTVIGFIAAGAPGPDDRVLHRRRPEDVSSPATMVASDNETAPPRSPDKVSRGDHPA